MTTPSPLRTFRKDPSSVLDYGFDWSEWLGSGDIIVASSWIFDVVGLTTEDDLFGDDATSIWLSGGTDGVDYLVTNRITTLDGRTEDRTMQISVAQR